MTFPKVGIGKLCALFGKTRHALYDHQWRHRRQGLQDDIILQYVYEQRKLLPRIGTRKLHHMIEPLLQAHGIKVGRDYLFDLLAKHKLLIRQRKRRVITTDSRHWMRKYANLVTTFECDRPEQLWVSDITYIRMANQWGYLSLITDAYSRRIMGYCLRTDLSTQGCMEALQMALANRLYPLQPLIHHSDRGTQYCSEAYVNLLKTNDIAISMTQHGDPYENALAERVNGIIKTEFNLFTSMAGFEQTCLRVRSSIQAYNEIRPHDSCDRLTPQQAHGRQGVLKKRWKNYQNKKTINQPNPIFEQPPV